MNYSCTIIYIVLPLHIISIYTHKILSFFLKVMFMLLSAMPFAIGQVQDAGLIFLSKMASSIAQGYSHYPDNTEEEQMLKRQSMISTAVITLGLGTACLGFILVVVGRAKMAKYLITTHTDRHIT